VCPIFPESQEAIIRQEGDIPLEDDDFVSEIDDEGVQL
jgi:hypothetical protein